MIELYDDHRKISLVGDVLVQAQKCETLHIILCWVAMIACVCILPIVFRKETASQMQTTKPTIIIDTVVANVGDASVEVKVSLVNNPGIYSIGFNTNYDDTVLTLKSVTYSTEFGGSGMAPPLADPFMVSWFNNAAVADVEKDGSFVTFVFDVSADAVSGSVANISIVPNTQEFYNAADNEVALNIVNGGITIQ